MIERQLRRGDIYWVEWEPARGSEQAGRRPSLVIQEYAGNANPKYPNSIVLAITTKSRGAASQVSLNPSVGNGLTELSFVKCEQVITISKQRLVKHIGTLESADMSRVGLALKKMFELQ